MASIEPESVLRMLGYRGGADERARAEAERAVASVTGAVRPRAVWRLFSLAREDDNTYLGGVELVGADIARHLAGCAECAALCVTLGATADSLVRAAESESMSYAATLDCAASELCEAECDALERAVRARLAAEGRYLTARFSPGYGDLPLETNAELAALLDAPRSVGVSASEAGALVPRKSVIALCGVSDKPARGALAGCESCKLRDKCDKSAGGKLCER